MQKQSLINRLIKSNCYNSLFLATGNPVFFSASREIRNGANLTLPPVEIENETVNTL